MITKMFFKEKEPSVEIEKGTARIRWPYKPLKEVAYDAVGIIIVDPRTDYDKVLQLKKFDQVEPLKDTALHTDIFVNMLRKLALLYNTIAFPEHDPSYKPYTFGDGKILEIPIFEDKHDVPGGCYHRNPDLIKYVYIWPRQTHNLKIRENPFDSDYYPKREIIILNKEKLRQEDIEKMLTYNLNEGMLEVVLNNCKFYRVPNKDKYGRPDKGKELELMREILRRAIDFSKSLSIVRKELVEDKW